MSTHKNFSKSKKKKMGSSRISAGFEINNGKDIMKIPKIWWLHFPKCGTSFLIRYVIMHVVYQPDIILQDDTEHGGMQVEQILNDFPPDKHCEIPLEQVFGHMALRDASVKNYVFANFRNPHDRIISAYHSNKHAMGLSKEEKQKMLKLINNAGKLKRINTFANYPGIMGCQVKMVLGKHCAAQYDITEDDLKRAKKIVESFLFLGLTEEWNRTICLFHFQFGGRTFDVEYLNSRLGSYNKTRSELESHLDFRDYYDEELHKHVRDIVKKRFAIAGC
eukprot:UN32200